MSRKSRRTPPRAPLPLAPPPPAELPPPSAGGRGSALASAAGVLIVGVLAAAWVFVRVASARGPLVWDEGGYLMRAYVAAEGMRHLSPAMVWGATGMNPYYPPLAAWLPAPMLLLVGPREAAGFAFSGLAFAACALLLWLAGRRMGGTVAGAVAVLFLLGSRLHLEYTATAMLELPGTALTMLGAWLYLRHLTAGRRGSAWLTGVAIAALFFYKYNFGLFLAAAVFASEALRRPRRPFGAATLGLWLPLLVAAGAWLLVPGKLAGLLEFSGNRTSGLGGLTALLFYPRALIDYYAAWPPAGWLAIAGAVGSLTLVRREDVRFLVLLAGAGLVAMALHPYKLERAIVTVTPALWLLCGAWVAALLRRLDARPRQARLAAAAVALVLLAPIPTLYARDLPGIARTIADHRPHPWSRFPWPGLDLLAVQNLILSEVDPRLPIYVVGEFNELAPTVLWFKLSTRYPQTAVVNRANQGEIAWQPPLNLVTIEVLPESRYFNEDYRSYNAAALDWIHPFERTAPRPVLDRTFPEAGVRVRFYRMASEPVVEG